jgi:hypothetical protein
MASIRNTYSLLIVEKIKFLIPDSEIDEEMRYCFEIADLVESAEEFEITKIALETEKENEILLKFHKFIINDKDNTLHYESVINNNGCTTTNLESILKYFFYKAVCSLFKEQRQQVNFKFNDSNMKDFSDDKYKKTIKIEKYISNCYTWDFEY